jgi:hypothetical protein
MRLRNYWKNDDVDVPDEHAMQLLHLYVTLGYKNRLPQQNGRLHYMQPM